MPVAPPPPTPAAQAPAGTVTVPKGATWSTALLALLKAPPTPANYKFLNQWFLREHDAAELNGAQYGNNPFFTTIGGSSSVGQIKAGTFPRMPGNSAGVAMYPNEATGVWLNAYHMLYSYPSIVAALRTGNPASYQNNSHFQGELKAWSGGGYQGFATIQAPSGPVGATIETDLASNKAPGGPGGGLLGKVAGALKDGILHEPLVAVGLAGPEAVLKVVGGPMKLADFLGKLTDPHFILRGLQIVAGGVMVGAGVILLVRQVALAADLPDPAKLVGPGVVKAAQASTAGGRAATAQAKTNPRTSRQGTPRRTERVRPLDDQPRAPRPSSSSQDYGTVPF